MAKRYGDVKYGYVRFGGKTYKVLKSIGESLMKEKRKMNRALQKERGY